VTVGGATVAIAAGSDGAAIAQAINAANITGYSATYDATNGVTLSNSAGNVAADLSAIGLSGTVASTNYAAPTGNDQFSIAVGTASQQIDLADGTYTADALADEINRAIDGGALKGLVRASVNEGKIEFKTTATGEDADVTLTEVTGNTGLSNLGFTTGDTDAGAAAGPGTDSVESINISTAGGAQDAIAIIDAAINEIDQTRGDLGAIQNRFASTISNLDNISE